MNTRKTYQRHAKIIAAFMMVFGFVLMLTEFHGGPWAGTFLGLLMFAAGAADLFSGLKKIF